MSLPIITELEALIFSDGMSTCVSCPYLDCCMPWLSSTVSTSGWPRLQGWAETWCVTFDSLFHFSSSDLQELNIGSRYNIVSCIYFVPYIILCVHSRHVLHPGTIFGSGNCPATCCCDTLELAISLPFLSSHGELPNSVWHSLRTGISWQLFGSFWVHLR